ncbi:peptide ABC transporter substrate-binding protein [Thiosulfatimonas sediminis]|uniref:Peptide ABC transporter substrate-binding protein n=2 Tax=Thiosulfatimonas sediminis TaxID=2675054 RepID=A0A6F8PSL8_9GAMM|nr:peptide ABC transporter substrate-binding protein [Thiosulfatimonas sediminis]
MKKPYDKEPLTPKALLDKYIRNGLIVADRQYDVALAYFHFVGAYRLKGYLHHYIHPESKSFPESFDFEYLRQQYEFDRELRGLIINAIDRIEVAIRTVMSNSLSLRYGAHWFLNDSIFNNTREWNHEKLTYKIREDLKNAQKRTFVQHYYKHYDQPELPPSWAVSEIVSFGFWSKTYSILKDPTVKKAISMKFDIDQPEVFRSWIHSLTVLRNHAAHHAQILRSPIRVKPSNYKRKKIHFQNPESFATMKLIVEYYLDHIPLPNNWSSDIDCLFTKYNLVHRNELNRY